METAPSPGKTKEQARSEGRLFQINLHHNKAAMAVLHQQLAVAMIDVALTEKPWIMGAK